MFKDFILIANSVYMKTLSRWIKLCSLTLFISLTTACHPTHFVVGNGPQQNKTVVERNKFLFLGLKHVGKAPDPKVMCNNAKDYKITVKLTFADVLLNGITLGIYSPLTVMVEY
jgi:hypothetical protein